MAGVDLEVVVSGCADDLFAGPGEVRARCRALDWAATPLGPAEQWPGALRAAVRLSLDSGIAMCIYAGPELVLVYNDRFMRAIGDGKHPWALGRPAREIWPEMWERIRPEFDQVLGGGPPIHYVDQTFVIERDEHSEETYWTYALSPVRGEDGAVIAVHSVVTETTPRVRAEVALRASEQRLRRMVNVEGVGVLTFEAATGTLIDANDAFLRMTGYTREVVEARKLTWRTMTPPEYVAVSEAQMEGFTRTGRIGPYEKEYLLADGSRSWMLFAGAALGNGMVVEYCIDASDRKRAEAVADRARAEAEAARDQAERARAEAEAARRAAEAANRAKSEFLAVMSHELRTPLNAIGGYAELMEMGIRGPVTEHQREDLRRIERSQKHLLGLINEVLNYARLETGAVQYDLADVRVRDALAGAEALVAPQALTKGLALTVVECSADFVVRADAEKLRQVLVNLLSNAVKFTARGGRIELTCTASRDRIDIVVRDTGVGIAADQLERIFDPFVQVRADLTRPHEGTGLGLAISRDLARGMGGDLTATSTLGVGSAFTLTLPRAVQTQAP